MENFSDEDSDEPQNENKRVRYPRRMEKQRLRRPRVASREFHYSPLKEITHQALIFDNGGYSIKLNYSTEAEPKIIPNCIMKAKSERKRLFIGNQIDECRDCSGLFYLIPSERGYITKWDVQKPIWDYAFSKSVCPINSYPVIMTQPLFNFKSIQDCIDEIFFEEYEINSMLRVNPTDLAALKFQYEKGTCSPCIVIDSGYSFTHMVPYLEGKKYLKGVKRINVGGKLLTNHLKDIISYRQYHVMEETFVINQVKEDTCYVSSDFKNDLKRAELPAKNNPILRNYVLPDFNNIRRGYIHDPNEKDDLAENCQILKLNNERFTVPEILFKPSDISIKSIGIAEAIVRSILACPKYYQKDLAKNIICVGGSTKFPGFKARLFDEVRVLAPTTWDVKIHQPDDPVSYCWQGGKALLKDPNFKTKLVTKQEYEEFGLSAIQEKYNDWATPDLIEDPEPKRSRFEQYSYIDHVKKYDVFGKGLPDVQKEKTKENDEKVPEEPEAKNEEEVAKNKVKKVTRSNGVVYSVKIVSALPKTT